MADTIKKIGIKNASGSGYDSRDIGAEAKNIEVPFNESGSIITDDTAADRMKSLAQVLSDNNSAVKGKAPENHADATDKYGAASTVKYGHVKLGTGFITGEDGETSVAYSTENTSGAAVEANDPRLGDARKNPQAVTFSNGKASATTEDYDGSEAKTVTYSTVGAAPQSHASADTTYGVGSATNYGHVKAGTGLTVDNGTLGVSYGTAAGTAAQGNDSRLSDARTPKYHAATTTTYGGGNASNYGHVKLTDTYSVATPSAASNGAATSIAASAYALQQAYSTLNSNLIPMDSKIFFRSDWGLDIDTFGYVKMLSLGQDSIKYKIFLVSCEFCIPDTATRPASDTYDWLNVEKMIDLWNQEVGTKYEYGYIVQGQANIRILPDSYKTSFMGYFPLIMNLNNSPILQLGRIYTDQGAFGGWETRKYPSGPYSFDFYLAVK